MMARSRKPFFRWLSALALLLPALASACSGGDRRGAQTAEDTPRQGGTLVIAAPSDLEAANSLVTGDVWTQEVDRYLLYLPLLRYRADLTYEPALAQSWDERGDSVVTFHLRRDVRWHDGARTTAYDVAFTFDRVKDPKTAFPGAAGFERWKSAEVTDSFTVRFRVARDPDPLASWVNVPIMPRHLLDSIPPERLRQAAFNHHPVGNGPFRFVSWKANDRWVFEANRAFPEALGGRPLLDRVVWRVVPDGTAELTELYTDQAQLVLAVPGDRLDDVRGRAGVRVIVRPSLKYAFIAWNGLRHPFDDARVRRALTLAIDRQQILDVLRSGEGTVAASPIGSAHWAHDPTLDPLPYDTAAARATLAEAGYRDRNGDGMLEGPDGRALAFELLIPASSAYNRDMAEMIRSQLERVGVRVTVRPVDYGTLYGDIGSPERRFDAALLGWETEFRPELRTIFHSSALGSLYQAASYSNPAFDAALDSAENAPSRERALPYWHRAERILRDEEPWTFLFFYPDLFAARDRLRGVHMDVRGALRGIDRWWLTGAAAPPDGTGSAGRADTAAPADSGGPGSSGAEGGGQ